MIKYIYVVFLLLAILSSCKKVEEKYAQFYTNNTVSVNLQPTGNLFYNDINVGDLLANSTLATGEMTALDIEYKAIYIDFMCINMRLNDSLQYLDNIQRIEFYMLKPNISNPAMISYDTISISKLDTVPLNTRISCLDYSTYNLYNILKLSRNIQYKMNIVLKAPIEQTHNLYIDVRFMIDALLL